MVHGKSENFFNKIITTTAQNYLAQGYVINTDTMCGRNSLDLRKDKHFVRIWIDRDSAYHCDKELDKQGYWGDVYFLKIGATTLQNPNTDTVWNDRLDVLSKQCYYEVGRWYNNKAVTDSRDEAIQCAKKASSRWETRSTLYTRTATYKDIERRKIAFQFIKKLPQTKSIRLEHVTSVDKEYNDNKTKYWYVVKWHTTSGISKSARLNWIKTY